jgi:ATP-dependent protease ClpP protease subunit
MDVNNLTYVVGKVEENRPAVIRFFGSVSESTTRCFNDEFLWLQDYVKPSKIVVLINSEGGSVIHGMSTFSIIQSCPIEVDCIIEGIAASMGSVIWAAGDRLYMHDYSLLMIHNPFIGSVSEEDETIKNMIAAFRGQLEMIYHKRFGLPKDQVKAIMDGEGNADGTYFSASEAVKAGILESDHVIKTSKQLRDKVKSSLEGVTNVSDVRDMMSSVAATETDANKLVEKALAILEPKKQTVNKKQTMDEYQVLFDGVAAQLNIAKDTAAASVTARITELLAVENELKAAQANLDQLNIKYSGKEAEVVNLTAELAEVKNALDVYKQAEVEAKKAAIEAMVQDAVNCGKIDASAKEQWEKMANTDMEMVKQTLASIPAREVISKEIAQDPENVLAAEKSMQTTEEEVAAKVKAVIGDVQFRKF